ncbi:type II toxin-antitoxin system RelE/ParE family toxin [Escherichia coli]|uniref:type II toxin-antitoxin system RelE/ParE family toxin n=1 Tax=Escherichia coli TaxID=562 RepID=UPI00339AF263
MELKINGSHAYRCVYYTKSPGKVVVLRFFKKTTNGPARKDLEVVKQRLKNLK